MSVALVFQIILLPVHVTLIWLFLRMSRARQLGGYRAVETFTIITAVLAWVTTALWIHLNVDPAAGAIWPYVLATAMSFLIFSIVLAVVLVLRSPQRLPQD